MKRRAVISAGLSVAALGAVGYGLWPRLGRFEAEVARQREVLTADPGLAGLVHMATLAANGHNTQPWFFEAREAGVRILPDMSRRTQVVDPDDHHLFVSLGCAAENLMIAAAAQGRQADLRVDTAQQTSIEIALSAGREDRSELFRAIPLRQSTRSVYDGQALMSGEIDMLRAAAQQEGVSVLILTEPSEHEVILELLVAANSAQMDDPAFVAELIDWIRFSPERALATKDGLFAPCSGNPATPEVIGKRMFNLVFRKNSENDKYRDQVRSSAGIAVFVGDRADPDHWIRVGRSFQRFALQATTMGIRTAHINQPLEVVELRPELALTLGLPGVRPDLMVRFGRAPVLPMSLRRDVGDVMV